MPPYWLLFKRDMALASSHLADSLNPVLFFALVVLMFPLALGASQSLLTQVAPGLLWVAALLSVLMSLERIFRDDLHEGLLAQWWCRGRSLVGYAAVRVLSTWLTVALPLVLLSPVMVLVLGLPSAAIPTLMLSLFLGTGVLVAVGAVGSALTTGLPKAGILLALIVLPFYIPVLIFGASDSLTVSFRLTDMAQEVPVVYEGILPDLFREGQGVIVTGRMQGNRFIAEEVLAKHDENYMPPEVADSLKKAGNRVYRLLATAPYTFNLAHVTM